MGRLRPKEILSAFETREGAYTFGPYGRANPYWSEMVAEKAAMARLLGVLSRLGRPAPLVQCDGQVEATNEAADKLLGDGIAVVHHRLRSSVSREQRRLDQLVSQALAPDHSRDATEQNALYVRAAANRLSLRSFRWDYSIRRPSTYFAALQGWCCL